MFLSRFELVGLAYVDRARPSEGFVEVQIQAGVRTAQQTVW
jgi:hypothetical protein